VDADVAVIGAGVIGAAVALALARRGARVALLEAEAAPGLAASGTNSGILHTGFDSTPGELETRLILRAAEIRDPVTDDLAIPVMRCGAMLRPRDAEGRATVIRLAENAKANGVYARVDAEDGSLTVPGESVTDPVAHTLALASAAVRLGVPVWTRWRVEAISETGGELELREPGGERLRCSAAVNCAGLQADEVAGLVGDRSFEIYPRKGEFIVFDPPGSTPLARILLPVPTARTKGVLVFPTLDGKVVAGPTAVDQVDKDDWSVRESAAREILTQAVRMYPPLEGARPVAAYAGLRPAGRGVNYAIGVSPACERLVNVAAVRSTGLTASLGIAEHVTGLVRGLGVELGEPVALPAPEPPGALTGDGPWWRRTAEYRAS
jgi:glycerol-3-phosphate dehydrogenase